MNLLMKRLVSLIAPDPMPTRLNFRQKIALWWHGVIFNIMMLLKHGEWPILDEDVDDETRQFLNGHLPVIVDDYSDPSKTLEELEELEKKDDVTIKLNLSFPADLSVVQFKEFSDATWKIFMPYVTALDEAGIKLREFTVAAEASENQKED